MAGETSSISELGGGGIGIQGENSNRVDGLNYGTGDATSTPETLTWTLNAPVGLELVFKSWSFIEGTNGDIRVSNGTTNSDFPNMTGATGTLTLPNLPLANGGSLTFKEIPGMGATTGAGIAGFSFAVTAPAARPKDLTTARATTFGPMPRTGTRTVCRPLLPMRSSTATT